MIRGDLQERAAKVKELINGFEEYAYLAYLPSVEEVMWFSKVPFYESESAEEAFDKLKKELDDCGWCLRLTSFAHKKGGKVYVIR